MVEDLELVMMMTAQMEVPEAAAWAMVHAQTELDSVCRAIQLTLKGKIGENAAIG